LFLDNVIGETIQFDLADQLGGKLALLIEFILGLL